MLVGLMLIAAMDAAQPSPGVNPLAGRAGGLPPPPYSAGVQ